MQLAVTPESSYLTTQRMHRVTMATAPMHCFYTTTTSGAAAFMYGFLLPWRFLIADSMVFLDITLLAVHGLL